MMFARVFAFVLSYMHFVLLGGGWGFMRPLRVSRSLSLCVFSLSLRLLSAFFFAVDFSNLQSKRKNYDRQERKAGSGRTKKAEQSWVFSIISASSSFHKSSAHLCSYALVLFLLRETTHHLFVLFNSQIVSRFHLLQMNRQTDRQKDGQTDGPVLQKSKTLSV
mmetsp:Transcript_41482/g.81840  ORF Transcript_41482/g.81840 Transcript_41482/m.81840 type:complete len:163 (+) Transcript_41482:211-699(+)